MVTESKRTKEGVLAPVAQQKPDLVETAQTLLDSLDPRSKDVVSRRYGITSGTPETLEGIGREYGITRERVRQIQSQAKKVLRELDTQLTPVGTLFERLFAEHGGVLAESHVIELVQQATGQQYPATVIAFYLDVLPSYQYVTRDRYFAPHWRRSDMMSADTPGVAELAEEYLRKQEHPIAEEQLLQAIQAALASERRAVPAAHIWAQLRASKNVHRTPFGEWGLAAWPETHPRGVGDKAYAVLRRHGKPEHFTRITELINKAHFDHKTANAQTVHNELIKDKRFVLVGRGLYGLAEWGYIPGTVADVIESLLAQAGKPLTREEVIEQVLAQRQVKKNTILLGLQNHDRFMRTDGNRYTLK